MHGEWEKKDHTIGRKQHLGLRSRGEGEEVEWEVFGREKIDFLLREIREKWNEICAESIYRNTKLDGSRAIENLSSTNSRQIYLLRCCWESVDGQRTLMDRTTIEQTKTISMDWEFVEKLLSQIQEIFDGSRLR